MSELAGLFEAARVLKVSFVRFPHAAEVRVEICIRFCKSSHSFAYIFHSMLNL